MSILRKILKVFLILAAIALIGIIVFAVVLSLGWPWWVGIFISIGLLGLWIAYLFVRRIMNKRREQQFVHEIIEQDEAQLKQLAEMDKSKGKELQDRWKEAVETLKQSHLKKRGNPLYVLPWYLVIGESGSGKTTAIQSARLDSPFAEVTRTSGISGTKNCDWWFFEQAIILDTAGRWSMPVDEKRDKDEWQKFLMLLAKYRQREPINGLIVSVGAEKILQATPESLEEYGRNIRRRTDELMRVLGAKFPVYVLVTKGDLIQGMTQFCNHLPDKSLEQAMGFVNHNLSKDVVTFLDKSFDVILERLRDLRLLILHQTESRKVEPSLLLFPEEFEKLRPKMEPFLKGAFLENPFQETPALRGIFFSSGRQEGSPFSHFLQTLGLIDEKEVLPGTNRGLFLHDFFSKILPRDRGLFAPTKRSVEWERITKNLGLAAWVALGLAFCGLLSFSFFKNVRALQWAAHEVAEKPKFQGDIMADMATFERIKEAILKVEEQNRGWWIPRFGLTQSMEAEIALKNYYCSQFQENFLNGFDQQLTTRVGRFSASTPDEVLGQHVSHVVRRINILKARLDGGELEGLQAKPQPTYDPTVISPERAVASRKKDIFGNLYLYYIVWRLDANKIKSESESLQKLLDQFLALRNGELHWLSGWTNAQPSLHPITIESFWGGSLPLKGEVNVTPAYTRKGKEMIDAFLVEIEQAMIKPRDLAAPKSEFANWYRQQSFKAWNHFLVFFPKGSERLRGREEWQRVASKVATDEGPYLSVLNRAAYELEPLAMEQDLPPWLKLVFHFQPIKLQTFAEGVGQEKGFIAKAAEKGKSVITDLGKTAGQAPGLGDVTQAHLKAAQKYGEYQQSLFSITPVSSSQKLAFDTTSQAFSQDPISGQSTFFSARRAAEAFKSILTAKAAEEDAFWKIFNGPLDFLWIFMRMETACYLQKQWEEEVLTETQGIFDRKAAVKLLLGNDGYAWKFARGTASPFLSRHLKKGGYYPKEVEGDAIPFNSSFVSFLNEGAVKVVSRPAIEDAPKKSNYPVTIECLPPDINAEAKLKPHAINIELRCDSGPQKLENFMYRASTTINWSPDTCSDLILTIHVGDVVLTKTYGGSNGFPSFLNAFRGGAHTFYAEQFPEQRAAALDNLGIRQITVKYRFLSGHAAAMDASRARVETQEVTLPDVPEQIVKCWER